MLCSHQTSKPYTGCQKGLLWFHLGRQLRTMQLLTGIPAAAGLQGGPGKEEKTWGLRKKQFSNWNKVKYSNTSG